MPRVDLSVFLVLACAPLAACVAPPVEAPLVKVEQQTYVSTRQVKKDKVDLLFLVDDSGSMGPKQAQLKARFGDLIKTLDTLGTDDDKKASYHIGVITSSMGAPGIASCPSYGGRLQAPGKAADAGCQPPVGKRYIEYDQRTGLDNFQSTGQDLAQTFGCMASVGTAGCGFEMPLEAVYHALRDPLEENAGFLRDDAVLAIVFLTDEDDCSVEPTSDLFTNPQKGVFSSFRCARYGITCDGQFPLSETPMASYQSCSAATPQQGSALTDLQKYLTLLTLPKAQGGIKDDPRDVVLASISGPGTPFGTQLASGRLECGAEISCTKLSPSCTASFDPGFRGDPAVRLSTVIDRAANHSSASICGSDVEYKTALEGIGGLIVDNLGGSCLSSPITDRDNPECVVEEVVGTGPGATRTSIPSCKMSGGARPCWELEDITDSQCKQVCDPVTKTFQRVSVQIRRDDTDKPINSTAEVSCLTVAIPNQYFNPDEACLAASN